jgi:hypothetical protein
MTAQISEILIVDGERMRMAFCPPLPRWSRALKGPSAQEKEAANSSMWQRRAAAEAADGSESGSLLHSTACWRRYRGTWEIVDGKLYLMHIEGDPELEAKLPLHADWFTGVLRVPIGEMLLYVHMGFGSVYEREIHIRIERGGVVGRRIWHNRGKQFSEPELEYANMPGVRWSHRRHSIQGFERRILHKLRLRSLYTLCVERIVLRDHK